MQDIGKNLGRIANGLIALTITIVFSESLTTTKTMKSVKRKFPASNSNFFLHELCRSSLKEERVFQPNATNFTVPGFSFVLLNSTEFNGPFSGLFLE